MIGGYIIFILDDFHVQLIFRIRLLRGERRKASTAAGNLRVRGGGQYISAHGADIELRFFHIAHILIVFSDTAGQQGIRVHAQRLRQIANQRGIGQSDSAFPAGNRLFGHAELLRDMPLRQALLRAQIADQRADFRLIHPYRLL